MQFKYLQDAIMQTASHYTLKTAMQVFEQGGCVRALTFEALQSKVNSQANKLKEIGILPGNRVILLAENCPEAMVTFFAILSAGATVVLIDPMLPKIGLQSTIEFADASALLLSEKSLLDFDKALFPNLMTRNIQQELAPCAGFCSERPTKSTPGLDGDPSLAVIVFTSGTTGQAKGVMLTHENLLIATEKSKIAINLTDEDQMLSVLQLHHISPLMQNLVSLYSGVTITFLGKFNREGMSSAMQIIQPTIIGVVPLLLDIFLESIRKEIARKPRLTQYIAKISLFLTMYIRIYTGCNLGRILFSKIQQSFGGKLTRMICGGAPANSEVLKQLQAFGLTILEAYGLTETTGPICSNSLRQAKTGSVGLAFPDMEIRIDETSDQNMNEILIKGPMIMKGYFRNPEATRQALKNGWFHTGDRGTIDRLGFLKIIGRIKDTIVLSSGKKVVPLEIESYYQGIESISELAVFGVTDTDQKGEIICAAIVIDKDIESSTALRAKIEDKIYHRASQLAVHLQIQRVYFLEEIPKNAMMKVKRVQLPSLIANLPLSGHASISAQESEIEKWIKQWIVKQTGVPFPEIEVQKPFSHYGLNSLNILQLCEDLQNWLEIEVDPTLICDSPFTAPSIVQLTSYLKKKMRGGRLGRRKMKKK